MVLVGQMLSSASQEFLTAVGSIRTSADLMRAIGVKKDVANRFLTALGKRDPLAVVYYMPGVDSLRQLTHGARTRIGEHPAIHVFEEAVRDFEQFLQSEMGGRHALDAMASAWLPEARERFELTSRQMIYRGMANLHGLECDIGINTSFIHPSNNPDLFDNARLEGIIGLRRLKPAIPLLIAATEQVGNEHVSWRTIDGRLIEDAAAAGPADILPAFSSCDPTAIRAVRSGKSIQHELIDPSLGASRTSDIFFGHYVPNSIQHYAVNSAVYVFAAYQNFPVKRMVLDVLIHKDCWPSAEPELAFYNTSVRGLVRTRTAEQSRLFDRIDLLDSVRRIGTSVECCRIAEAPRYIELLQWVCEQRGWNPADFRVYRCDSRYPPISVQYSLYFPLPPKPEPSA